MATNPYLSAQADAVTNTANNNLFRYQLPGIRSGAMAAGGYGGSRQGIAEGNAIGQTNQGIAGAVANMQGQAYDSDQNRATQQAMQQAALSSQENIARMNDSTNRYGLGNQFTLGQGQLGLGRDQMLTGFFTNQRGQDLQQAGLGASLYGQGMAGLGAQGQGMYQTGVDQTQAGINPYGLAGNIYSQFSGLGGGTNTSAGGGTQGAISGALGGGLSVAQLLKLLGGG